MTDAERFELLVCLVEEGRAEVFIDDESWADLREHIDTIEYEED